MKKWTKVTVLAAPLVFATTIYAFANEKTNSQATTSIKEVTPASTAIVQAGEAQSVSLMTNPFLRQKEGSGQWAEAATSVNSTQSQGTALLTIQQIHKLQIQSKTDRGELHLEYHLEGNGTPRLNGKIGDVKIHLSGEKAKEMMNQLLTRWDLYSVLQQSLTDGDGKVQSKIVSSLEDFEMETTDGKKVKLDDKKEKQEKNDKEEESHEKDRDDDKEKD